jgi:hypothetical protein
LIYCKKREVKNGEAVNVVASRQKLQLSEVAEIVSVPVTGLISMKVVDDDGGRAAAGFKGTARDCVTRSIAIVAQLPYADVYAELAKQTGSQRPDRITGKKRPASARNGINTKRKWFKDYMASLGFKWTPTMAIGQGCKVHLVANELPPGRLIVAVSRHYTAVIDGVIYDNHDPSRDGSRCVYGYWSL